MEPANTSNSGCSGLARTLRSYGLARPTATRRAFQPIRNNLAPALAARFASSVGEGKVHQVIGAVVDGMQIVSGKALRFRRQAWTLKEYHQLMQSY